MTPDPDQTQGPGEPDQRMGPTGPALVTGWIVAGLLLGWAAPRLLGRTTVAAAAVSWLQVLVLAFAALVLAGIAWLTWRRVHVHREPVGEGDGMVNRLVLARACVLVGALLAGGCTGYAVSWLGVPLEAAGAPILRALLAAAAAAAMTVAALLLERACRVPSDPEST